MPRARKRNHKDERATTAAKREALLELCRRLLPNAESCSVDEINAALIAHYAQEAGTSDFRAYPDWIEAGCQVRLHRKGYAIWQADGAKMTNVFHAGQVCHAADAGLDQPENEASPKLIPPAPIEPGPEFDAAGKALTLLADAKPRLEVSPIQAKLSAWREIRARLYIESDIDNIEMAERVEAIIDGILAGDRRAINLPVSLDSVHEFAA